MRTLNDHNHSRTHTVSIEKRQKGLAGVICPRCQTTEMVYKDGVVMMVDPPKMRVECPECGFCGEKIV